MSHPGSPEEKARLVNDEGGGHQLIYSSPVLPNLTKQSPALKNYLHVCSYLCKAMFIVVYTKLHLQLLKQESLKTKDNIKHTLIQLS